MVVVVVVLVVDQCHYLPTKPMHGGGGVSSGQLSLAPPQNSKVSGLTLAATPQVIRKNSANIKIFMYSQTHYEIATLSPNPLDIYQTRGDRNRTMGNHG